LASSFITLSSNSQVDSTTGNLINYGTSATDTTSTWNNGVYVNQLCFGAGQPGNCGPNPSIREGNYINFSYGTADLNQVININRALAAGGTGVQLSGFNFGFMAKNGNGWDDARQDYLAAYVKLYNSGGGLAATYDYSAQTDRKYNWTNFNFSETFASPLAASNYSNAQVGFVGRDNNFWAGNYGPEIFNVSFSLKYRVDPCALNPAYSATCPKFNTVATGTNLFNSEVWGSAVTQSFAINTALKNGGIGATVHGFNYGFDYNVGQSWYGCTATNQDGSCSWYMNIPAQVSATARLTNSNNQSIYSKSHALTGDGTSGSMNGQYLLPTSLNQASLGRVSLTGNTSGTGSSIGNFSASLIYTADPCVSNPLYNASCSGYAVAFAKNMLLGSTVASASGPIVSSGGNPMSANTGHMDQGQGNTQPEQPQQQSQQQQQQQSSPPQDANQQPAGAHSDSAQPAPAGSPGPAGGPLQAQASGSSSQQQSGGSAGPGKLAMSVVKSAQDKDKATQNAAVSSAAKTLENTMQSSQASSNAAISMVQDMSTNSATAAATFASQTTQASQQTTTQYSQSPQTVQAGTQTQQGSRAGPQIQQQQDSQQALLQSTNVIQTQQFVYTPSLQQDTQSTQLVMIKPPVIPEIETQQSTSGNGIVVTRNLFAYNPVISSSSSNMSITTSQSVPMYQPKLDVRQDEVETPQYQMSSFSGIGKAGNPLSEIIMQQRFELMQNNITQPLSSVNKNVLPNELAGSIDIASIANVPVGFNAYSFVLKDASFYEIKEVYKNQQTVDNVRLLRGLTGGSDAKHQEMVNQQYK